MIKYQRPTTDADFDTASTTILGDISAAKLAASQAVAAGNDPDFPNLWGKIRYKRSFVTAQGRGKCGYCEAKVLSSQTGAIEHFRPKSEVSRLTAPGKEAKGTSNVIDRTTAEEFRPGYWWLAYEWNNYLFACERCNTGWKRCLFPVDANSPRTAPLNPGVESVESALLLNPFDDDPVCHFDYDSIGQISGRSPRGLATIETCGLDRESLRDSRQERAEDVEDLLKDYALRLKNGEDPTETLKKLVRKGRAENAFAGVARSRTLHMLGMTWQELEEAASAT